MSSENSELNKNKNSIFATAKAPANIKSITENANSSAADIVKSYRELIKDPKNLDEAANYMYETLLDDAIFGVFLEIHQLHKTGNLPALDGVTEDAPGDTSLRIVDKPNCDIFGCSTAKKPMDCICPNCDRPVLTSRFAPHLEKCMGMGRTSSRIASRRLATKESPCPSSSSSNQATTASSDDDEDDEDWSPEKRTKKSSQNSQNSASKKNNRKKFFK